MKDSLLADALALEQCMTEYATGYRIEEKYYLALRAKLVGQPIVQGLIPDFVVACRSLLQFWDFIKEKYSSYKERRSFIREQFGPLLLYLESGDRAGHQQLVTKSLLVFDHNHVNDMWAKALDRRVEDPEGAITAARSLMETVCKHILSERGVAYEDEGSLPKLYKATAQILHLSPDDHREDIFKQILSGCNSTVHGFASLRNHYSDAHGQALGAVKPSKRHAELAVNLAGTFASFLIQTHQETKMKTI
ncbi:MAG TPA: abortive infection family protein [Candidatus Obscuribacterales bacterium]